MSVDWTLVAYAGLIGFAALCGFVGYYLGKSRWTPYYIISGMVLAFVAVPGAKLALTVMGKASVAAEISEPGLVELGALLIGVVGMLGLYFRRDEPALGRVEQLLQAALEKLPKMKAETIEDVARETPGWFERRRTKGYLHNIFYRGQPAQGQLERNALGRYIDALGHRIVDVNATAQQIADKSREGLAQLESLR
jgi:hypothetical protein